MFYPSLATNFALSTANAAESDARTAEENIDLVQHDVHRLLLLTEALWTLMKKEHGYTDDALMNLVQQIDQTKTNADGTVAKDPPQACPTCGRPNAATRSICLYCGNRLPVKPFAR